MHLPFTAHRPCLNQIPSQDLIPLPRVCLHAIAPLPRHPQAHRGGVGQETLSQARRLAKRHPPLNLHQQHQSQPVLRKSSSHLGQSKSSHRSHARRLLSLHKQAPTQPRQLINKSALHRPARRPGRVKSLQGSSSSAWAPPQLPTDHQPSYPTPQLLHPHHPYLTYLKQSRLHQAQALFLRVGLGRSTSMRSTSERLLHPVLNPKSSSLRAANQLHQLPRIPKMKVKRLPLQPQLPMPYHRLCWIFLNPTLFRAQSRSNRLLPCHPRAQQIRAWHWLASSLLFLLISQSSCHLHPNRQLNRKVPPAPSFPHQSRSHLPM